MVKKSTPSLKAVAWSLSLPIRCKNYMDFKHSVQYYHISILFGVCQKFNDLRLSQTLQAKPQLVHHMKIG